jgi:hypothetical protein
VTRVVYILVVLNPVSGGITGPPCSWEIYIREPGPPGSRIYIPQEQGDTGTWHIYIPQEQGDINTGTWPCRFLITTLFLGDINTGTWPSRLGESQVRQLNMVKGSERLEPLSDYTANCRPVLSSERASHRYKTANLRQQHSGRK